MRLADVQLSADDPDRLLIDGIARNALRRAPTRNLPSRSWSGHRMPVGQYAARCRLTLVEKNKEYFQAAAYRQPTRRFCAGTSCRTCCPVLMDRHLGLVWHLDRKATLSFLGLGVPATQPSRHG